MKISKQLTLIALLVACQAVFAMDPMQKALKAAFTAQEQLFFKNNEYPFTPVDRADDVEQGLQAVKNYIAEAEKALGSSMSRSMLILLSELRLKTREGVERWAEAFKAGHALDKLSSDGVRTYQEVYTQTLSKLNEMLAALGNDAAFIEAEKKHLGFGFGGVWQTGAYEVDSDLRTNQRTELYKQILDLAKKK